MSDSSIDIEEAIRAYRDRPSMEKELEELREKLDAALSENDALATLADAQHQGIKDDIVELATLRAEVERLKAEMDTLGGAGRIVNDGLAAENDRLKAALREIAVVAGDIGLAAIVARACAALDPENTNTSPGREK